MSPLRDALQIGLPKRTRPFLCRLGFHKKRVRTSFFPGIIGKIMTEYSVLVFCARCPMILDSHTYTRDAQTGEFS